MIEEIIKNYSKLNEKRKFIENIAAYVGRSPNHVSVHWFNYNKIPKQHQAVVLGKLKEVISLQDQFYTSYSEIFNQSENE